MITGRALLPALMLALLPGRGSAQQADGQLFGGVDLRTMRFETLPVLKRLRQTVIPFGAIIPVGRLTIDVGSSWASTRMDRQDGTSHTVDGLTDTQVRGAFVLGRDAVVATVLVNLPTGLSRASPKDYTVIGAVSPGILGFPVASYASGFSVTSGLVGAVQSGNWSFGLAGSLRVSSEFTPYADDLGPITYKPGLESRIRGGADGLIGQSRLSLGVTYSTFGDDHFGQAGISRGQYRPGPRWVIEAAFLAPLGGSTLSLSAWNFRRSAGDTTGVSARNRENLSGAEAVITIPVAPWLAIEPLAAARFSNPQAGSARMLGAGSGLRIQLGSSASLSPVVRFDRGRITDPIGNQVDLTGFSFSAFLRVTP